MIVGTSAEIDGQMAMARSIRKVASFRPVHAALGGDDNRHPWSWCGLWATRRPLGGFTDESRMTDDLGKVTCHACLLSLRAYARGQESPVQPGG